MMKIDMYKKVKPAKLRIWGYSGEWIQAMTLDRAMRIYEQETGDDDFTANNWEERPLDGEDTFFLEDVTPEEVLSSRQYYVPDGGKVIIKDRQVFVKATRRQWLEFSPYEKCYFSENI